MGGRKMLAACTSPARNGAPRAASDSAHWAPAPMSTPDRDGRARKEGAVVRAVLPTLISSSPGKSPAPAHQRPAVGRPMPKIASPALPASPAPPHAREDMQGLPRVSSGQKELARVGSGEIAGGESRTIPSGPPAHRSLHEDDLHAAAGPGGDRGAGEREMGLDETTGSRRVQGGVIASLKEGDSMKQFLDFRKISKKKRLEKLQTGPLPAHTQEMLRDLFYPPTPDVSQMLRRSLSGGEYAGKGPVIFPRERALYKRFLKFCRGSSLVATKEDKKANSAEEDGSEEEQGPTQAHVIDLKGYISFMKNVGLIPPQKHGEPIAPQYAVSVQCYKAFQQQCAQRTLHFPEFKQVIHQFLQKGPDLLELEQKNKREEIRELELKIARMLPNCNDPVADVKAVFRQLFDTIFEAFIFFDVSGDWTCTKVEFIQYCKMLQLPLTPADLEIAMSDQHLEELDSLSFVRSFKWYPLVEKPKFKVMGYIVNPSENRLYQVFAWISAGVRADRILEMISEKERMLHAAFIREAGEDKAEKDEHSTEAKMDERRQHESQGDSLAHARPFVAGKLQPLMEETLNDDHRDESLKPASDHTLEKEGAQDGEKQDIYFSEKSMGVADSSERSLTFQQFLEFLQVVDLIPVHLHRPGGKMKTDLSSGEFCEALRVFRSVLGKEKRLEWPEFKECLNELLACKHLRKELAEAERDLQTMCHVLRHYAPTSDAPLESFKDALSIRFDSSVEAFVFFDIQGDWSVTQAEVQNMVKRLNLPLTKPDLESALQALFIASHGGGINSNEFVRRLKWTKDDVRKVKEVFDLYPNERKLFQEFIRWCDISNPQASQSDGNSSAINTPASRRGSSRVLEVDEPSLLKSTGRRSTQNSRVGTAASEGSSRPGTTLDPGAISRLNTGAEMPHFDDSHVEPAERDMSSNARLPFTGFQGFIRAIRLLKTGSSIEEMHLEYAKKAFETVNWQGDQDNVISWVEFKHVLHVYLLNLGMWLQPDLEKLENDLRSKRAFLHQKVCTFTDPIAQFSALLATRFDDVFEAFVFFDVDGDWQVTNKEMQKMLPKLRLPMTSADLDMTIAKFMREKNNMEEIFVDPKQFAKNLAWHPKPGTAPGLRRALDQAKEKRAQVLERALTLAKAAQVEDDAKSLSVLPEDEPVVAQIQSQIHEIETLQRDFRRIKTFFGIPFDGRLAMDEADIQRRKEIAKYDLQQRALRSSDKGISVLLDRARLRRSEIEKEAIQRSQDDVYSRKLNGYKLGAAALPSVETLLKWVGKNERLELSAMVQKVNRVKAAIHRFELHGKRVFNVHVGDMPMSTKERHTRQEMFAHNRRMKKLAIEGEHQIMLDGLDEAKLRRRSITEVALKRAEVLQGGEWAKIPFPSDRVQETLKWFEETARQRLLGKQRVMTLAKGARPIGTQGKGTSVGHPSISRAPSAGSQPRSAAGAPRWGPMDANRIYAAPELMIKALEFRFPTIFDAWCFFDPDGTWDVSATVFRAKSSLLRLSEEHVDVEGVIRKLDTSGEESIGPLDFVNILKWHELEMKIADMRVSFDAASKRKKIVADVALRRSAEPPSKRPWTQDRTSVADEVAKEDERHRKQKHRKLAAESAAKQQKMRELFGPPQIIKDFARQRDWKRLLDLQVDVLRLSSAVNEIRVAGQQDVLGVSCEDLSFRYFQRCSVFYDIPNQERDEAATMIQRSLRAVRAWRNNEQLKILKSSDKKKWGFGRSEPREEILQVLRRVALESGFAFYGDHESYTDLGGVETLALEALSVEEARAAKVRADMAEARAGIHNLEHWAVAEIKVQGSMGGERNFLMRLTAEAVCILLGGGGGGGVPEWGSVTKLLHEKDFKQRLLSYDSDDTVDESFRLLATDSRYSQSICHPEFEPKRTGKAAEGLCLWVRAVCTYKLWLLDRLAKEQQPPSEQPPSVLPAQHRYEGAADQDVAGEERSNTICQRH